MEILFIGCCLDTDLRKRYLVTEVLNMWEVSMGGSHREITQREMSKPSAGKQLERDGNGGHMSRGKETKPMQVLIQDSRQRD
jgi:hypothetical protein